MSQDEDDTGGKEDFSSIFVIGLDGNHVLKNDGAGSNCQNCRAPGDENVIWGTDFRAGKQAQMQTTGDTPESGPPPCPWTRF